MSFFKPKFVLLALLCPLWAVLTASGCSGSAFTANEGANSGGSAGSAQGQAGSQNDVPGKTCADQADCNDNEACTTDFCNGRGVCDTVPKCKGTEKCCAGDCAECCDDSDCDDNLECTDNQCFMGHCMFVPDDTVCGATEYCSALNGCRPRQTCGILSSEDVAVACNDGSTCTADECVSNLCTHTYCTGTLCCEGQTPGCAEECCNDSQCDKDADPCTVGACEAGKCTKKELCGGGTQCCPSGDGKTATCGACCTADDCDDQIGCTEDSCNLGQCGHKAKSDKCPAGNYCDPGDGCTKSPDCATASDCKQMGNCNPTCDGGVCHFQGCGNGTKCCASGCAVCCDEKDCNDNVDCTLDACGSTGCSHTPMNDKCMSGHCNAELGCVACETARDCDDGVACTTDACSGQAGQARTCTHFSACKDQYCDPGSGQCVQCVSDSDCQGGVVTMQGAEPAAIGTQCNVSKCVKGYCKDSTITCLGEQKCCPPYGCSIVCGIQTQ